MYIENEQRPQILIVDQDTDSRLALSDVLEVAGYRTTCAGSDAEALERLNSGPAPFLIVLARDPAFPDGAPCWHSGRFAAIPLVIVTTREECEPEAILPGTAARFLKPLDIPALLGAINSCRPNLSDAQHCVAGS